MTSSSDIYAAGSCEIVDRERRLIAMGEMAASLAHEIRNPLGSMELYCSLLKRDLDDSVEQFELADNIHKGIKRLDRIITNCLQFTKTIEPRCRPIDDPRMFLQGIIDEVSSLETRDSVEIRLEDSGDLEVVVDASLITQALLNLLHNALDACKESAADKPLIRMRSLRVDSIWRIEISDNGTGLNQPDTEKLFNPFFTTKSAGTGLGLAIVHRIAGAHGGTIRLFSGERGGALAVLELPIGRTSNE